MTPYDDGRPIDAAEAWSCAAAILYLLGVLIGALSLGEPRLALTALCVFAAGAVAQVRGRVG